MPVYPLTAGISNHMLAALVRQALPCAQGIPETLPHAYPPGPQPGGGGISVKNIHFPEDEKALALARRRLAFEELFYLAVGLCFLKGRRDQGGAGVPVPLRPREEFLALLPFTPTDAQLRVMDEAAADMASGRPMNRLVQGDVGSGKTIVAVLALMNAALNGFQAAMMAPTEVLARQHYESITKIF